jgi:hypothetical protein
MNGTWEQVQDLPLPLAEYSFGMGANPYVFEVNENSDAWFEFASPLAWSSAYVFGGETVNLETGEEAISSTFLSFQLESLDWQSYSLPASILAGKNQVLVHSPHISSYDSPLGGLGILAYLIGGEMVSADSMSQNIGYCLEFVESSEDYPFYTELTSTFAFGSWTCTPDLQLITPAFIQRGDRGYIIGGNDNGTGIWIDLSPTYVVPFSVTEFSRNTLSVFPNPSSDQMTLRGESHSLKWKLFDSWGRIILSGQGQEIKLNNLSPGPYHLHTEDGRKAIVLVEK